MAKRLFWVALFLLAGSIPAMASPCTDQCWLDYDACVGPGCSSYWHCAACDEARDNCLAYCGGFLLGGGEQTVSSTSSTPQASGAGNQLAAPIFQLCPSAGL